MTLACASGRRQALESLDPLEEVALTVRVRTSEGRPVPGAALVIWRAPPAPPSRIGTTDAQGTLRLKRRPGRYSVHAEARGFVQSARTEVRLAPESEAGLELTLTPAVPFSGRVVDPKGTPVVGAMLRLLPSGDPDLWLDVESDEQGRFVFEGVPEGAAVLRVEKEDWSLTRLELTAPQQDLSVVLGGLGSLRVRVLDPQGRLLPGGDAEITREFDKSTLELFPEETDEAVVYPRLAAGRYRVRGYYSPAKGCNWSSVVEADVLPEQSAEVTVSFVGVRGVGPLKGRAVGRDGRGLGNSKVSVWTERVRDEPGTHGTCTVDTDPDGRFVLPDPLEQPKTLLLRAKGEAPWQSEGSPVPGEDAPVVFQSDHGGLEGRVLGPDGHPVERFGLSASRWEQHHPQGRYGIDAFFTQTYQWIIDADGFATALVRAKGRPHEVLPLPDVILDRGRIVQGRVVAEDGRTGVPSLKVMLLDPFELTDRVSAPHPPHRTAITDADGRYRFEHVASRIQLLRVDAQAQGTVLYELMPDEASVDLRLVPLAWLSGTVTVGARVPLAGVDLNVRCEGKFGVSTSTDASGRYEVRVPGDRECFVHLTDAAPKDEVRPWPPPLAFSPQRLQLPPHAWRPLDFEARQGPAALHLRFPVPNEFLDAFLLPGEPPMPGTTLAMEALIRAGFVADWTPTIVRPERGLEELFFPLLRRSNYVFSALPLGRYTLFITQEMNGGLHVLRVPVDLKDAGTRLITSGHPGEDDKATIFPR
nr:MULTISPECIES: carboxypeptidase-like regulatory domain-containing protein [Corallococcus]